MLSGGGAPERPDRYEANVGGHMMNLIDKYAPQSFDEVMGNHDAVKACRYYAKHPEYMPHLLFEGYTGTGKTTLARLLRDALGIDGVNYACKNASSERGIDHIRGEIMRFMRYAPWGGVPFKLLVLEEADQLTPDAQKALKVPLETYSHCRVIFITNHMNGIIPEIRKGRCHVFTFNPIDSRDIMERLNYIVDREGLTDIDLTGIAERCEGSMRDAISLLQKEIITGGGRDYIDELLQRYEKPISAGGM